MSQIDPKWISIDDTKLIVIDNAGTNELSIRDDVHLDGVSVEFINTSKIEVRYLSEGDAPEDAGRDMSRDVWLQIPNPV